MAICAVHVANTRQLQVTAGGDHAAVAVVQAGCLSGHNPGLSHLFMTSTMYVTLGCLGTASTICGQHTGDISIHYRGNIPDKCM